MGPGKVLVTGATGFVAGQCIKELLEHGYDVRGTVRGKAASDISYLPPLADGDGRGTLEFAEATLDSDVGWAEAASGCDYVLHVAAPIPFKAPKNEDEIIRPTVEGTKRVLRAAATAGVRRVVYTSSTDTLTHNSATAGRVRTEEDWSDPAECWVYAKGKLLAERFAWEFAAAHPDGPEVAVVIPGAVIGPPLQSRKASSADIIRRMLAGQMPVVPRLGLAYSDVRDLAVAHRLAMELPGAAGNRYICADEHLWMGEVAAILKAEYGPRGYKVATRDMPYWLMRAAALVNDEVKLAAAMYGVPHDVSAAKAKRELGWTPRPVRQSILETAEYLISAGIVSAKPPKAAR
jgi:nucleoside-diphosphate-sugar epimerase